jgi:predicted CopG family antitoxin
MTSQLVLFYFTHLCYFMNRLTTITIRQNNYERLRNLGKTGETFNDVLTRILDQVEAKKDQKK